MNLRTGGNMEVAQARVMLDEAKKYYFKRWRYAHPCKSWGIVSIYLFESNVFEVFEEDLEEPVFFSFSVTEYYQKLMLSKHRPEILSELEKFVFRDRF